MNRSVDWVALVAAWMYGLLLHGCITVRQHDLGELWWVHGSAINCCMVEHDYQAP